MRKCAVPLLVCLGLALLAGTPLFATDVAIYTENLNTNPGWTVQGSWQFGVPLGNAGDPTAGKTGTNVYGYNLSGAYEPNLSPARYLTTKAINCSGKYAVKLRFWRWLVVQDAAYDKATVQVSKDNTTWTTLYTNPTNADKNADVKDTSWKEMIYDISGVADNQATVYVRWGMESQSHNPGLYGGWNIDDVSLLAAGPTAFYTLNTAADWTADAHAAANSQPPTAGTGWQFGPAVAGGGQMRGTPPVLTGADPGSDADGVAGGNIFGYRIGANYYAGMTRSEYLTSRVLDCTGRQGVTLRFMRWLDVEDAAYDKVKIQATNKITPVDILSKQDFEGSSITGWTFSGDPATGPVLAKDAGYLNDTQSVKFVGTQKMKRTVSTTDMYNVTVSFYMGATSLEAGEKATAEYSIDGTNWVTLMELTADTAFQKYTFDMSALSPKVENNANFALRFGVVSSSGSDVDDLVYLDDVLVKGVKWTTVWSNPQGPVGSPADIMDSAWSQQSVSIASVADGQSAVYVRFAMGPTDYFSQPTEFGGWSLDNIEIVENSSEWEVASKSAPAALLWETSGAATVGAKNDGTATWNSDYSLVEVIEPTQPVNRWNIKSKAVSGTVAPGATYNFSATALAPPLTSVIYATPFVPTAANDESLSTLELNFNMKNKAGFFVSRDLQGNVIYAQSGVVTARFPDILPGTAGAWARFFVEELSGRVPRIIQGFPDGTYRPLVELDRAAIAVYIQRAANIPLSTYKALFRDVPSDFWAALEIEACASSSPPVVTGFPDFTYRPTLLITRDGMAKFIANGVIVSGNGVITSIPPYPSTPPFPDVPVVDDATKTPPVVKNPFAAYILALKDANIVQGYPDGTYRPAVTITRDQLAVYVWRAFIRDPDSAVVLGGPAITSEDLTAADWVGWPSAASIVQAEDENYAYAVFDAARMGPSMLMASGPTPSWDVKFELRAASEVTAPPSRTGVVKVLNSVFNAAVAAAQASGEPYMTVYWPIPTGLQGDFKLVVSVGNISGTMSEVLRQPAYSIRNRIFLDDFEAGIDPSYQTLGSPAGGGVWWDKDPKNGTHSVQFAGTQKLQRNIPTTGHYKIQVSVAYGADKLSSTDHLRLDWSKDGGVTWTSLLDVTNRTGDTELTKQTWTLPADAENNPLFTVRFGVDTNETSSFTKFGYIDDLEIRGT